MIIYVYMLYNIYLLCIYKSESLPDLWSHSMQCFIFIILFVFPLPYTTLQHYPILLLGYSTLQNPPLPYHTHSSSRLLYPTLPYSSSRLLYTTIPYKTHPYPTILYPILLLGNFVLKQPTSTTTLHKPFSCRFYYHEFTWSIIYSPDNDGGFVNNLVAVVTLE